MTENSDSGTIDEGTAAQLDAADDAASWNINETTAAQLDAADDSGGGRGIVGKSAGPPPDDMSRVIEKDAEKRASADPEDLSDGTEW